MINDELAALGKEVEQDREERDSRAERTLLEVAYPLEVARPFPAIEHA